MRVFDIRIILGPMPLLEAGGWDALSGYVSRRFRIPLERASARGESPATLARLTRMADSIRVSMDHVTGRIQVGFTLPFPESAWLPGDVDARPAALLSHLMDEILNPVIVAPLVENMELLEASDHSGLAEVNEQFSEAVRDTFIRFFHGEKTLAWVERVVRLVPRGKPEAINP